MEYWLCLIRIFVGENLIKRGLRLLGADLLLLCLGTETICEMDRTKNNFNCV